MKWLALILPLQLSAQCYLPVNDIYPTACTYISESPSILAGETVTRCYILTPEISVIQPGFISVQTPGCGPVAYFGLTYDLYDDTCGYISSGDIYPPGANPFIFGLDTDLTYTLCFSWEALCEQTAVCATYYLSNLPVELLSFTGQEYGDGILLKWSTGSENGSSHFSVRRSTDLSSWRLIGVVGAAGVSQTIQQYSLVDRSPVPGVCYYRLQQFDLDGSFRNYDVISVSHKIGPSTELWFDLLGRQIR
jgi:hypothetical protein